MSSRALLSAAVLSVATLAAHADPLAYPTYPNGGAPAPTVALSAIASGDVVGTFVSSNAGGEDTVRMFDVTANTYSPWLLDNRSSVAGSMANFGHANAGDQLVFEINNADLGPGSYYVLYQGGSPNPILASDGSLSVDGDSHAFVTSYAATGGTAAYSYFGMEDLPAVASDFDYNDLDFSATNVTNLAISQAPEPATFALLGTGLVGFGGMVRRRLSV